MTYKLIKMLSTPFEDWEAYQLGLIDEKGNVIRKPVLNDEKKAFGMFNRMICKLKSTMNKLIGQSRAAAILSTLYLMREENGINQNVYNGLVEYFKTNDNDVKEYILINERKKVDVKKIFNEVLGG